MSESQRQSIPDGTYTAENNVTATYSINYGNSIISNLVHMYNHIVCSHYMYMSGMVRSKLATSTMKTDTTCDMKCQQWSSVH